MDKRVLFTETLTSLVEFAAAKGNKITQGDVKLYFYDIIDKPEQYTYIYDYLKTNKITVEGITVSENITSDIDADENTDNMENSVSESAAESEEELAFIDMYMQELNSLPDMDDTKKEQLISDLGNGDLNAVNPLVECQLPFVASLAGQYRGQGVTFGDLIQEGNIALMLNLPEYNSDSGDFQLFVKNIVTNAFDNAINAQVNSNRISRHLADKLNQLDTATKTLTEVLGRVPEIGELATEMGILEDEAAQLLKTSLDTLSVNTDTQITDENTDENNSDSNSEDTFNFTSDEDPLTWRVNK